MLDRRTVALPALMAIALAGAAGCRPQPSDAERAREDARAVAMVEAAQKASPPPVALAPQPISGADLAAHRLSGSICRFGPRDPVRGTTLLVASERRALLKLEGRFMIFAADIGSPAFAPGLLRHYVGKSHALTLDQAPGDGTALGADALRWRAVLTIRDAWNQIVFTSPGEIVCGP